MLHSIIRTGRVLCAGLTLVLVASVSPAWAQDTRAEAIAQEKARKAQQLHPYVPSKVERIVTGATRGFVALPGGWFPAVGSVYSGGGFSLGPGYRQYVGDNTFIEARAMYSVKQYKLASVSLLSPTLFRGTTAFRADGGWRDATQVGFYGVGMDTSSDDRANFRLQQAFGRVEAEVRPNRRPFRLGVGAAFEDNTLERGQGRHPSIEEIYSPLGAPGLGASPDFIHLNALGGIDWRPSPGYARRGGLYQVGLHAFRDTDGEFDFERFDAEIVQHLPIARETWVLSLRGRLQSTVNDDDAVPYFMLPSLGSGSTLRGYSTGRLRDRHALLLQAEWRWTPNRTALDVAIFYDMGKVASRRGDLDLNGMKSNVGIGFRFHGPRMTPLRIELARGNEGINLVFAANAAF